MFSRFHTKVLSDIFISKFCLVTSDKNSHSDYYLWKLEYRMNRKSLESHFFKPTFRSTLFIAFLSNNFRKIDKIF